MQLPFSLMHAVAGLTLVLAAGAGAAEVLVVVSAKSAATALSAEQAADIFLGNASTFPGGGAAVPVDQAGGSALRDEFYTKVSGKTSAQLKAHWSKLIFTGKARPPKEIGDSVAVRKQIADNPNMIGYIDSGSNDSSVKVVLTLR